MRCVKATGLVAEECAPAAGGITGTRRVEFKGVRTSGRVATPVVLLRSAATPSAVLPLPVVLLESAYTRWLCCDRRWCSKQGDPTNGRVTAAGRVAFECSVAARCIVGPVVLESIAKEPTGCVGRRLRCY